MTIIFDIETNGLLETMTKLHCSVLYNTKTDGVFNCKNIKKGITDGDYLSIESSLSMLQEADEIAGHNIVKFDIPAIQLIYPDFNPQGKIFDTLLMSKLVYPDIGEMDDVNIRKGKFPKKLRGKYSLKAWGFRLGILKGDYNEQDDCWAEWSIDMQQYCEQDVMVTKKLYELLKSKKISQEAIELEHQFARIIFNQEQRGVKFDREKAIELNAELLQKKYELEEKLRLAFPNEIKETVFIPKSNNKTRGYVKGQPFIKTEIIEFNPSSRQMIAERLINKYGWKPKKTTPTGLPTIDEEVLEDLNFEEAPLLKEYFLVTKTLGQLSEGKNAWLKLLSNNDTIKGRVDTMGAVTGRCTHSSPNLAQVPSVDSFLGKECRELFIARTGYKLVGCDASGLELRCLAHYMNDTDYTEEILNGDIHTKNQTAAGLPTRTNAKTFIYGFLYGAGDAKIGSIIGKGSKEGKRIKTQFLESLPKLKSLLYRVKSKVKTQGFLLGIDKRKLKVRAEYMALNVLLQSAGAIVMKKALCILSDDLGKKGWKLNEDYAFVLNIHDEYQAEIKEKLVDEYKIMAVEAIRKAGEYFGFRCPLDGESKVGSNWAETH